MFDSHVKVHEPVTDYRTCVSGIRQGDLHGPDAMDFGMCRHVVSKILRNKILVGHGLENDLNVLHLKHPRHMRRDSAMYTPFLKANLQPRRLRDLVFTELGLVIQREGQEHDSIEDAWAAMQLYQIHRSEWDTEIEKCHLLHKYQLQLQRLAAATPPPGLYLQQHDYWGGDANINVQQQQSNVHSSFPQEYDFDGTAPCSSPTGAAFVW